MPKFFNSDIADLAHQLTLSPRRLRVAQLQGVEALLATVKSDTAYPFEYVCHAITQYRRRGSAATSHSIPGQALIEDLCSLAEVICRKANLTVAELGDQCITHQQLADELDVSTKTVRRWRSRGLLGLRANCDDGVNRLVFMRSTIDRFMRQNQALVAKAASFKQMSLDERDKIIDRARELLEERPMKLHAAACRIAEEMGRAVETVRYTLRRFEQNEGEAALFGENGLRSLSEQHVEVWDDRSAGSSPADIAKSRNLPVADVHRLLREAQVQKWQDEPLEWIHNELFESPNADALILDVPEPEAEPQPAPRIPKDVPAYLKSLYHTPLLTREQEQDLFRRYNFVRYKAARQVQSFDLSQGIDPEQFALVGRLKEQASVLKSRIVNANLRLVVSIAKRHVGWSANFFEIVSDGNMTLMRAIDKFDYALGNKFSTYGSWAIMKNYARSIPEEHYRNARYVTGQDEILQGAPDEAEVDVHDSDRGRVRELIEKGLEALPERERDIVRCHFGLSGKNEPHTLQELGDRYGVTKERIRQIEQRALGRLREHLSPTLIEALR